MEKDEKELTAQEKEERKKTIDLLMTQTPKQLAIALYKVGILSTKLEKELTECKKEKELLTKETENLRNRLREMEKKNKASDSERNNNSISANSISNGRASASVQPSAPLSVARSSAQSAAPVLAKTTPSRPLPVPSRSVAEEMPATKRAKTTPTQLLKTFLAEPKSPSDSNSNVKSSLKKKNTSQTIPSPVATIEQKYFNNTNAASNNSVLEIDNPFSSEEEEMEVEQPTPKQFDPNAACLPQLLTGDQLELVASLVKSLFEFESPNGLEQAAFVHVLARKFQPVQCMTLAAVRMMHAVIDEISSHIGKQLEQAPLMDSLEPPILYLLQLNSVFPKERLFLSFLEQLNSEKGNLEWDDALGRMANGNVGMMLLYYCEDYILQFDGQDLSKSRPSRRQLISASYLLGLLAKYFGAAGSVQFLLYNLLERVLPFFSTPQKQAPSIDLLEIFCVLFLSWTDDKLVLENEVENPKDSLRRVIVWSSRLACQHYLSLTPIDSKNEREVTSTSARLLLESRLDLLTSHSASHSPAELCQELLDCILVDSSRLVTGSPTHFELPEETLFEFRETVRGLQLMSRCEGAEWFHAHVINARLLPMIETRSESVDARGALMLIRLIGLVADRTLATDELFEFLAKRVADEESPHAKAMAVVSLLDLAWPDSPVCLARAYAPLTAWHAANHRQGSPATTLPRDYQLQLLKYLSMKSFRDLGGRVNVAVSVESRSEVEELGF